MLDLKPFMYSGNQFLVPYLGNISYRKKFSGWYQGKVSRSNRHEFYLITRGGGEFTVEDITYHVTQGNLIYIPARDGIHYNFLPGDDLADYYSINFQCALISHADEVWLYDERTRYHYQSVSKDAQADWIFEQSCDAFDLPIVLPLYNEKKVCDILSQIYQLRQNLEFSDFGKEKILLHHFLYEVISQDQRQNKEDMNSYRIHNLSAYIQKNYRERLSLENLCDVVHLSPSYVIALFKQYTHCSPMAYVNLVRIEISKEMLSESQLPISEIALSCGFQDAFYFSRKFKQITGSSPRQYRSQLP
ncbi:MAG: AraC family transcriptional regulator [Ruthenibacterium sp.]